MLNDLRQMWSNLDSKRKLLIIGVFAGFVLFSMLWG